MKLEYLSVTYYYDASENFTDKLASKKFIVSGSYEYLTEKLNEYGLLGWEMVSHITCNSEDADAREFYFKRIIFKFT